MKRRHLILGLSVVLALSLAIPALGGPLQLHGTASLRLTARKALSTGASVAPIAASAEGTAAAAQSAAGGVQEGAVVARAAASDARSVADGAQGTADGAQRTAGDALSKATEATDRLAAAENLNGATSSVVSNALTNTTQVAKQVIGTVPFGLVMAEAECPAGTVVTAGGYTSSRTVDPRISEPTDRGWLVQAFIHANDRLIAWVICAQR